MHVRARFGGVSDRAARKGVPNVRTVGFGCHTNQWLSTESCLSVRPEAAGPSTEPARARALATRCLDARAARPQQEPLPNRAVYVYRCVCVVCVNARARACVHPRRCRQSISCIRCVDGTSLQPPLAPLRRRTQRLHNGAQRGPVAFRCHRAAGASRPCRSHACAPCVCRGTVSLWPGFCTRGAASRSRTQSGNRSCHRPTAGRAGAPARGNYPPCRVQCQSG